MFQLKGDTIQLLPKIWRVAKTSADYHLTSLFRKMNSGVHLGKGSKKPALPDDEKLVIFSMRFCPFAHRVHLVLHAKNIHYHSVFINLTEKPEWLSEVNPLGKVPALQMTKEAGKPILSESLIICDFLDEKYSKNPLHSKDPLQKAKDKILIERFSSVIGAMYKVFINGLEGAPGALTEISQGLDVYEQELKDRGTTYFGGDKPGMLDYMIWPWCERSAMFKYLLGDKYEMDRERFHNLLKWRDLMITDATVQSWYLDGETHAKFMRTRRTGVPDYDMLQSCYKNPSKRPRISM